MHGVLPQHSVWFMRWWTEYEVDSRILSRKMHDIPTPATRLQFAAIQQ
jgi:hypothetical protein